MEFFYGYSAFIITFMEKIQSGESVPMLIHSALERAVNSVISSTACTMAGEAPAAKSVLAMISILTKLVMHWIKGDFSRTRHMAFQASTPHASVPLNSRKLVMISPDSFPVTTTQTTQWMTYFKTLVFLFFALLLPSCKYPRALNFQQLPFLSSSSATKSFQAFLVSSAYCFV